MTKKINQRQSWQSGLHYYFLAACGVLLLIYIIIRANQIPFTHDESFTFLTYVNGSSFWNTYQGAEPVLNNRLLNSFLMKLTFALFGSSELALRLPNILAFGIYLISAIYLSTRLRHKGLQILLFLGLTLNPMLLGFFALARGYGIGAGLMLSALAVLWYANTTKQRSNLLVAAGFGLSAMSVVANMSFLNFYLGLTATELACLLYRHRLVLQKSFIQNKDLLILIIIPISISISLLAFIAYPIYRLRAAGNFSFGNSDLNFISVTFQSLIRDFFYQQKFTDWVTLILATILAGIVVGMLGHYFYQLYKLVRAQREPRAEHYLLSIFAITNLAILLQKLILNTAYPFERSALFYYILLVLFLIIGFDSLLAQRGNQYRQYLLSAIVIAGCSFFGFNTVTNFSFTNSPIWTYDLSNRQMISSIKSTDKNPVRIGVNWIFMPSLTYYKTTASLAAIEFTVLEETKAYQSLTDFDYLYIATGYTDRSDLLNPADLSNFRLEQRFDSAGTTLYVQKK